LLFSFNKKKITVDSHRKLVKTYEESSPIKMCKYWFRRFRSGNFDVSDKEHSGQPKKFEDAELQELSDENSVQSISKLVKLINVTHIIFFE